MNVWMSCGSNCDGVPGEGENFADLWRISGTQSMARPLSYMPKPHSGSYAVT